MYSMNPKGCEFLFSVSVCESIEEKEASVLALALTLALFQYPERTKVATFQES
jgi:hypothetical protein